MIGAQPTVVLVFLPQALLTHLAFRVFELSSTPQAGLLVDEERSPAALIAALNTGLIPVAWIVTMGFLQRIDHERGYQGCVPTGDTGGLKTVVQVASSSRAS